VNSQDYDAIVIGSGAGGAAAAYRLVMGGLNVALLEKGDHLPTDGSTLDIQRVVHEGAFLSREPWTDGRGRGLAPEEHFTSCLPGPFNGHLRRPALQRSRTGSA
jgi:choline dehydrogenase-like flavoprotein